MRLANSEFFNRKALLSVVAAVALAGCQSTPEDPDANTEDTSASSTTTTESTTGSTTFGTGQPGSVDSTDRGGSMNVISDAEAALLGQTVFYFDFDKAVIKPAAYASLKAHASKLAKSASMTVRVEGHADERGTREYNMALGERRANAVAKFLRVNGVSASQMEVISYGEEKPLSFGHEDTSWSQNRRVELKY